MQIQADTQPVLPRPPEHPQYVLPARARRERLRNRVSTRVSADIAPRRDGPEGDRQTDPIKSCTSDRGDVLFGDERVVVVFHGVRQVVSGGKRREGLRQRPFVDDARESLVYGGDNERLGHEQTAQVHAKKRETGRNERKGNVLTRKRG